MQQIISIVLAHGIYPYKMPRAIVLSCSTLIPGGGTINLSVPVPPLNQWTQIVLVCSTGTNKIGIYMNAKFIASSGAAGGVGSCGFGTNKVVTIQGYGNILGGPDYPYYVDNVRIYGQALPISAIQSMYIAESQQHRSLADRLSI